MVDLKRSKPIIITENQIDTKTLEKINKTASTFERWLKLVSGSEYRGSGILKQEDTIVFTVVLKHFADLKDNGLLETSYDPKKLFTEYATNGNIITKKHENLIKDYQIYINNYLKNNGEFVDIPTSNQEKKFVKDVLKNLNWKKGKEIKKTLINNKKGEKYELEVNERGIGSIVFYDKLDNNGKYEKIKTVQFDMNEGRFNTELYQILVDGKMGVETFRAFLYQIKKIQAEQKIEEPVIITPMFSLNGYYQRKMNMNYGANQTYDYIGMEINNINRPMKNLSYEDQRKILYQEGMIYTKQQQIIKEMYLDNGYKRNDKKMNEMIKTFEQKIKGAIEDDVNKDFFISEEKNIKKKTFNLNFETMEKDFDYAKKVVQSNVKKEYQKAHLGLIDKYEMEIKNRIIEIKEKSKNVEDFLLRLNNDKIIEMYTAFTKCYLHMPDEVNIYEMMQVEYNKGGNNKVVENTLEKISKTNPEMVEKIENKYKFKSRNTGQELIDLDKMKKRDEELYHTFIYYLIPEYVKEHEKSFKFKQVEVENITPENKKEEPKKEIKISTKTIISKSPTLEETENFMELMKKNPALAKTYQNFYNNKMKIEGEKERLVVDGIVGKKTIASANQLPFDEFWALYNNQNTYEKEILPKIKKNIEKDLHETKKYNAYVQKLNKEFGGKPVEDKWIYLTSYINRGEPSKKEEKEKHKLFRN